MSKKGKKRGPYKEKLVLGFVIPKRGDLRGEKFLNEFVKRNEDIIKEKYNQQYEQSKKFKTTITVNGKKQVISGEKRFKERNKDIYEFVKNKFQKGQFYNRKNITNLIKKQLASASQSQAENIVKRIEADPTFAQELKAIINEKIDYDKLIYNKAGIFAYPYINEKGEYKVVTFKFIDYSTGDGSSLLEFVSK